MSLPRLLPLAAISLALAACGTAPKKTTAPKEAPKPSEAASTNTPKPSAGKVSPYAPAQEDTSKRGNYVAGGLYAPGVADTVPSYIPNVDAIPEPEVREEPRSRYGNRSPYKVLGKSYTVLDRPHGYVERGKASYYGNKFHGRRTSNQEVYDMYAFTAAHRSLPLPSYARVTNLDNGKSVVVRVNDRGPFHSGRLIDLSYAAAVKLGYRERGTANVEVRALTPGEQAQVGRLVAAAQTTPNDSKAEAVLAQQVATQNAPGGVALGNAASESGDYRFDMQQDARVMTAAEFDAWMRARRVRVATGKPGKPDPQPQQVPAQTPPAIQSAPLAATAASNVPASRSNAMVMPQPADHAVPAQTYPTQSGGVQLQVASFASPANAERALAMLRNAGVPGARLQDATVGGKRIWRLRVGPLAENAVSPLASRIAGLGFGQPAVVRE
ncbi:septal ring lytic transglycosylase RlpA family protein [Solilutibacter tolerans]|uniref:Endolytic peptidoglycan transglycosylase RlpA n=1 Tax=Solilutibacter tolerans TaxID=1604334 RepID=A0A1N6QKI2_9GAMM|nr:septal ring lytic transglycosylase RlpA family protein [Lysobacter tolerans]SIQ16846.1 rare lipoprotein A [Lysobacter tolerans]